VRPLIQPSPSRPVHSSLQPLWALRGGLASFLPKVVLWPNHDRTAPWHGFLGNPEIPSTCSPSSLANRSPSSTTPRLCNSAPAVVVFIIGLGGLSANKESPPGVSAGSPCTSLFSACGPRLPTKALVRDGGSAAKAEISDAGRICCQSRRNWGPLSRRTGARPRADESRENGGQGQTAAETGGRMGPG
jgi:hypothetical protein